MLESIVFIPDGNRRFARNAVPFQTAYSELYFCRHCWLEFSKEDLAKAINKFDLRKRNFGK